jgi:hypothetical protein
VCLLAGVAGSLNAANYLGKNLIETELKLWNDTT